MGINWKRVGVGLVTGGGSEIANYASGGKIYNDEPTLGSTVARSSGIMGQVGGESLAQKQAQAAGALPYDTAYGAAQSKEEAANKVRSIYGSEADNLANGVQTYMSGLRGNLNKNVADADIYNQQAGRERGIANAMAGLSGVDTSASNEQSRRNSIFGASAINEKAKRDANTAYGKSVGNIIGGVNRIEQQAEANRLASQPVPVAQEKSGGLFDTLFGWA